MRTILLILVLGLLASSVSAETVWCRRFNIGCPTPQEIEKAAQRCQQMAQQSREEGYQKAIADPWVWKLDGARSAEDYANMRYRLMMQICMRHLS